MSHEIDAEFVGLDLGDKRRNSRALSVARRFAENPSFSCPKSLDTEAELEGFYRLIENEAVNHAALLAPHAKAAVRRAGDIGDVIVAHDGTTFDNASIRRLLELDGRRGEAGFRGHFSLAIAPETGEPLGVVHMAAWLRDSTTRTRLRKAGAKASQIAALPSEMDRWPEGFDAAARAFERPERLIHVCDSETDSYGVLAHLAAAEMRFVLRGCYNRCVVDSDQKMQEILAQQPVLVSRDVQLARRTNMKGTSAKTRNPPRSGRTARLQVRASCVSLKRPQGTTGVAQSVTVNVVHVLEADTPDDCTPVEWFLLTTEPVEEATDALRVVDIYRTRWMIEEYFKALKTGCAYEAKQMESLETLTNCLALYVPIAWQILHLRFMSRQLPDAPVSQVLSSMQHQILQLRAKKPIKNAAEALLAVASLGGHIKYNGPPGWQTLWSGMCRLLEMEKGALLYQQLQQGATTM